RAFFGIQMKPLSILNQALIALFFASLTLWRAHAGSQVVISEFMASNTHTLTDEDGESSDWIEIHNAGSNSVNLLNWALTDKLGDSNPWRFPATNLNADGYLI